MLRKLPTKDSSAMRLQEAMMPQLSASSAPPGRRARIHMIGGRMNVTGMSPMLEMRPLQEHRVMRAGGQAAAAQR